MVAHKNELEELWSDKYAPSIPGIDQQFNKNREVETEQITGLS